MIIAFQFMCAFMLVVVICLRVARVEMNLSLADLESLCMTSFHRGVDDRRTVLRTLDQTLTDQTH